MRSEQQKRSPKCSLSVTDHITNNHWKSLGHRTTLTFMTLMTDSAVATRPQQALMQRQEGDAMKPSIFRTVVAGIAGSVVFSLGTYVTFALIGSGLDQHSGPLFNPSSQSAKFIAVWTQIEPLPLFETKPQLILLGYVLFCVGHAFLFRSVAAAWPRTIASRAWRLALVTWSLSYVFFEFLGPFNLLGEPPALVALELVFWATAALAEAAAVVAVLEARQWIAPKLPVTTR